MPLYRVVVEISEGYEKIVEAANTSEAWNTVASEDTWGDPDHGWDRTDDCYSQLVSAEPFYGAVLDGKDPRIQNTEEGS